MLVLRAGCNRKLTILTYLNLTLYLLLQILMSAKYEAHVMGFVITSKEVTIAPNVLVIQCMIPQ